MPARLIAGCMALVTALVCALMPLGPVQTRAAGSAFDPTTSTVALSPRAERVRDDEAAIAPASDRTGQVAPSHHAPPLLFSVAAVAAPWLAAGTLVFAASPVTLFSAVLSQPRARGPPVA